MRELMTATIKTKLTSLIPKKVEPFIRRVLGSVRESARISKFNNSPFKGILEFAHVVRYSCPNVFARAVPISERAQAWLEKMRRDGIVRIESEEFTKAADYLAENYFSRLESGEKSLQGLNEEQLGHPGLFAIDRNHENERAYGVEVLYEISFKDPNLAAIFLNPDISGMLYNCYQRQPYFRNQPHVQTLNYHKGLKAEVGDPYHVDHLHQIVFMLLVSSQTEKDTHMEYIVGTHKRPTLFRGVYISNDEAAGVARTRKGQVYRLIGKKGTLFIFDSAGVHRRHLLEGNPRRVLHCTINTGHHLEKFKEKRDPWPQLASCPSHTQRMFSLLR